MELTEHSCKRCGGALNSIGENRWKCQYCGRIYDDESAAKNTKTMSELFDQKEREVVNNLRRNLYDAVNAEFISNKDVKAACVELKKHLPDDFAANFYEVACSDNLRAITKKLRGINVEENMDEIESMIKFLIKSLQIDFLLELNNLVERAYKNTDLTLYEKYATLISVEAEKVNMGVYETKLPREVFIAYSSKDMEKVSELCEFLESQGLQCFVAARNLRHGKGSVENYDKALKEAMDHCKSFVFVSSLNSRQFSCDALGIEIPYIESLDKDNAPAEYRNNYISIPHKFKKPRVEYRIEESRKFNAADGITNEFFDGYERVYSPEAVASRILKQLVEVPVETPAPEKKPELKKICVNCGTENSQGASSCVKCRSTQFVSSVSEYVKLKNQQELEERRRREEEKKREEERKKAAASSLYSSASKSAPKTAPQPPKKKKSHGCLITFLVVLAVVVVIGIIASQSTGNKKPETTDPGVYEVTMTPAYTDVPDDNYPNEYPSDDPWGDEPEDTEPPLMEYFTGEYNGVTITITSDGVMTVGCVGDIPSYEYASDVPWRDVYLEILEDGYTYSENARDFVKRIVFEDGVTSIGDHAFEEFGLVEEVVLPESVKSIGYRAFNYCYALSVIDLSHVESIGGEAFCSCSSLTSIDLASVRTIGYQAFSWCSALSSVEIGESVEKVEIDAFAETAIYNEQFNANSYVIIGSCLVKVDPGKINNGAVDGSTFSDIVCIADYAVQSASGIISVTLPESVKYIGDGAFRDCSGLTVLNIPASVISIGDEAFCNCSAITLVTIAEGSQLKHVGNSAFSGCSSLATVIFPSDCAVEYIGERAFSGIAVTDAVIPASVRVMGKEVFYSCPQLKKVVIAENSALTAIPEGAFYSCTSLEEIVVSEGSAITSIGNSALYYCTALRSISFPADIPLTEIGSEAFYNCDSIVQMNIPSSVTAIGNKAFSECDQLSNVSIPISVTLIGEYAFDDCYYLEAITYLGTQDEWNSVVKGSGWDQYAGYNTSNGSTAIICMNGEYDPTVSETFTSGLSFALNSDLTGYIVKKYQGTEVNVIIPSTYNGLPVVAIAGSSFAQKEIVSVTVPASVKEISTYAFSSCASLTEVIFAEECGLLTIGEGAFKYCSALTSFTIPKTVITLSKEAFRECAALESIAFEEGTLIEVIGDSAFYNCEKLKNVSIPDSVTTIEAYAFDYTAIESLSFGENSAIHSIASYAFGNCEALKTVYLPKTLTDVHSNAFYNTNNIESATLTAKQIGYIPKSSLKSVVFIPEMEVEGEDKVAKIVDYLFQNNDVLESVVMSEDMTEIGYRAFYGCDALTNVTFSPALTKIGKEAFLECTKIESMAIPSGITSIGQGAFASCIALTSASVPATVTEFGQYVFQNCTSLSSVTLEEGLTMIGAYTFSGCSAITEITLPESLITVGDDAFYSTGLVSIVVPAGVTSLGNRTFDYCESLESVTIYGTPEASYNTFNNCPMLKRATVNSAMIKFIPSTNLQHLEILEGDIANGALSGYSKLLSVVLPSGSEGLIIGPDAFANCSSLMSITIPANIEGIGLNAFLGCTKLVEVVNLSSKTIELGDASNNGGVAANALIVHSGESLLETVDDYVFITVEGVHYLVNYVGDDTEIVLPESYNGELYATRPSTFASNETITSVTVRGTTDIADYLFYDCPSLVTVVIDDCVQSIGMGAFEECGALVSVTIGNGVSYIGEAAFRYCGSLKSVTFGQHVSHIGAGAFNNCSALEKIYLPASVTRIDPRAFYSCQNLGGVIFADSSYMWNLLYDETADVPNYSFDVKDASVNVSNFDYYYSFYWVREDVDMTPEVETEGETIGEAEPEKAE